MVNVIISMYVMKFLSKSQFVIKIKFRHMHVCINWEKQARTDS